MDLVDRFLAKVEITSSCWNWKGVKEKGYGRFYINGKRFRAHRISYELFNGPLIKGLCIDHLCRNHSCVNPNHLEQVSLKENILRGSSFSAINNKKTHCPQGHPYSGGNLYIDTNNSRRCLICKCHTSNKYSRKMRRLF